MAIDLRGIRNVGEFYSQHYLDALLASDLKATLDRWASAEKEGGPKSPPKRVAALEGRFFKALSRATGEPDPVERLAAASEFHAHLLDALGYPREPGVEPVGDEAVVPVLWSARHNGRPFLWIVEAPFAESEEDSDPFESELLPAQLPESAAGAALAANSWKDLLDGDLFRQEHPPRWVLLLAGSDVFLLERDKWHQGKYLHFALGELLGLRDPTALAAFAGLLHRETLLPEGGQSLLDTLDENSHKHAFAVSTDLKLGAQRAIELLANEAIRHKREVAKEKIFDDETLAETLTRECVTYLYRLLFLFYVEARGADLGVVPMKSEAYREGYSLEKLRELELVPLTTVEAREGFYIDDSLRRLFRLVQRGFGRGQLHLREEGLLDHSFEMTGLRSPLFDEARTPILRSVRLRNVVMQEVLQLLSLSHEKGRKERGRISYAQLGINQLGAVYEGLLSYRGFFAQEELYEVRAREEVKDPAARTFFVPASRIKEYDEEEKVKDERGRPIKHARGSYLFRLAGRDREKSASYYTPEVLTQCLTKYTLKERLGEPGKEGALSADEILELTICEPAMGSGAFLNEAVGQLAHAYLERKQAELGRQIPADEYQAEWQKVKYHFVVHNCYGVDLNPLAAELGKISLWLNVLQPGVEAPYLDLRIAVGNSLIGARREVFEARDLLKPARDEESWLNKVPQRVPLGQKRPKDTVYHFLVPDLGMAPFDGDKVVAELEPENVARIKTWRKAFCRPFDEMEVARLLQISERIDQLWQDHVELRQVVLREIRQPIELWGQPAVSGGDAEGAVATRWKSAEECEEYARKLSKEGAPGLRLKAVMDYWCALWFWPVREAAWLPTREEWIADVEALLESGAKASTAGAGRPKVVDAAAVRHRYFHWGIDFVEVFGGGGGVDIFLGNPPWIKVQWEEAGILADFEPSLLLRNRSAKQVADARSGLLAHDVRARDAYIVELEAAQGSQAFLGARQNYPLLRGVHTNLYKCFLVGSWSLSGADAAVGLFHQTGIFDDPNGGALRKELYDRLSLAVRLQNKLTLFEDVKGTRPYAFTVTRGRRRSPDAIVVSNIYHPRTLDESFVHDGFGPVPGIKDVENEWDLRGHRARLVKLDVEALDLFSKIFDPHGTPALEARLPVVHSQSILEVLRHFRDVPRTPADLGDRCFFTEHFNETAQQKDGTIMRSTRQPRGPGEWIVSGPHFYVATPFSKTPNANCRNHRDYASVDLVVIPDDYLPLTNYLPACSQKEYLQRAPLWQGSPVTERFRHVHREMVSPTGERTLVSCIIPPGAAHIHTVFTVAFESLSDLLVYNALSCSVPVDFFVKSTGMGHVNRTLAGQLPCSASPALESALVARALRLNCLTKHYSVLWAEACPVGIARDGFARVDPRLGHWRDLGGGWVRASALRTPFERRQALVELDAIAALVLGLALDELVSIYSVQFPVLKENEAGTFYDQRGKVVFTINQAHNDVGLDRKQWEEIKDAQAGDKLPKWAHDAQGPFVPPFDRCDREADMAQAYEHFSKLLAKKGR